MRKISFVVTNTDFVVLDDFKKDILKIIDKKYDHEFIFVSTTEDKDKQHDSKYCKFVTCDSSLNKQIKNGFKLTDNASSCIILCDMSSGDYKEYVAKLIESWEKGAKVVRLKKARENNSFFQKVGNFFLDLARKVNNFICRLAGYKNKLYCYNSYQLFDKEAYKLINALPEKNAYFRNNDVLTNLETSEIITSEKLVFKNNKLKWSKKAITSLVLLGCFVASVLIAIFVYPVSVKEKFSINFVATMILLCIGFFAFSIYFYCSALLDCQLDRK